MKNKIHPIFRVCLSPGGGVRHDTNQIAVRGGWRFATDGKIIVRETTDAPETACGLPSQEKLGWERSLFSDDPVALVRPGKPTTVKCRECDGKYRGKTCDVCQGKGRRYQKLCLHCLGHGRWADCHFCDEGKMIVASPIDFGAFALSDYYVRLIFPWVKEVFPRKQHSENCPVYFRVRNSEIEGLLMPVAKCKQ